ncbi:peroxidase 6 [Andrographis paniculata]|uniref:peroxidase 6 n=1 Tax=Andrographis paniculata TaxID=175694 RepID=UPI0021E76087|nr:peroxidase 6 [Andrographis paniculata]
MTTSKMAVGLLLLLVSSSLLPPAVQSHLLPLTPDYYRKSCPRFSKIVQEVVVDKQLGFPTTAAGALRLLFHDCVVGGCDASLLIASNAFNEAERDSPDNRDLPGDAFDVVTRAKTRLELECPGVVSCADILAEATRDLVSMVGGPFYGVRLGRLDATESRAGAVEGHIARPNMSLSRIIDIFAGSGLGVPEMVALAGAHTIGFSHCAQFAGRIFSEPPDPSMNPAYAEGLRKLCANYTRDPSVAAFNDPMTPGKFDNMYYLNLQRGIGLLASDQAMAADPRTRGYVDLYAANQTAFFQAFARAMEKVGEMNVLLPGGGRGEVRRRCDATNTLTAA